MTKAIFECKVCGSKKELVKTHAEHTEMWAHCPKCLWATTHVEVRAEGK